MVDGYIDRWINSSIVDDYLGRSNQEQQLCRGRPDLCPPLSRNPHPVAPVCVCVCVCVCACARARVCIRKCIHNHMCRHAYGYKQIPVQPFAINAFMTMYAYMYVGMYVDISRYAHTCIEVYTDTGATICN